MSDTRNQGVRSFPHGGGEPAPLSFAQQSVRFLHELHPGSPARNVARAYRLTGPLDVDRLRQALTGLTARHEILRSVFGVDSEGRPVQLASEAVPSQAVPSQAEPSQAEPIALPVILVPRYPLAGLHDRVRELARDHLQEPFDPGRALRLRAWLFRIDAGDHVLLLCADPMVADDWSLDILAGELGPLYGAQAPDAVALSGDQPGQYAGFAAREQDGSPGRAARYWERKLDGLARLELPTDRPRTAAAAFAGFRRRGTLSAGVTDGLKRIASDQDATLFMVMAAAFAALLARRSGQDDVAMGAVIANRARRDRPQAVGRSANILVLRIDVAGDPDFLELLARVRDAVHEAQENQDTAFGLLAQAASRDDSPSRAPLVDVLISCADAIEVPLVLPEVAVSEYPLDPGIAWFDLEVFISAGTGGLAIDANCRADLFEPATIERMVGHFGQLLAAVCDRPWLSVSCLPLLSEDETAQLMQWGGVTEPLRPTGKCLHELFADQVAARPQAPAVRSGERVLSYRELDERADRISRALRGRGVGPDVGVGVCVERSIESVVALLGVVKAGGCYLPLDPTYPPERLSFMLADSAAAVLITTPGEQERIPGWVASTVLIHDDGEVSCAAPRPGPGADPGPG